MVVNLKRTQYTSFMDWHGHTCIKNRAIRRKLRYKDAWQIDRFIANYQWDIQSIIIIQFRSGDARNEY